MRTTTIAIANALRKGVEANFAPENQAAELERICELLLDMAASLEMNSIDPETGVSVPGHKATYAALLGDLGWQLDVSAHKANERQTWV